MQWRIVLKEEYEMVREYVMAGKQGQRPSEHSALFILNFVSPFR